MPPPPVPPRKAPPPPPPERPTLDRLGLYIVASLLSVGCIALLAGLALSGGDPEPEPEARGPRAPLTRVYGGGLKGSRAVQAAVAATRDADSDAVPANAVNGSTSRRLVWPIGGRTITSNFGTRLDPVAGVNVRNHRGVDIRSECGTPVLSTAAGKVLAAGWSNTSGWVVRIAHPDGMLTRYAHLSQLEVTAGDWLRAGERIGLSGATGRTTGPHLHFEIWKRGSPRNPLAFDYRYLSEKKFERVIVSDSRCGNFSASPAFASGGRSSGAWSSPQSRTDAIIADLGRGI